MNQNPDLCPDCPTPLTCQSFVRCIREPEDDGCLMARARQRFGRDMLHQAMRRTYLQGRPFPQTLMGNADPSILGWA